jgi:hypothetical protein
MARLLQACACAALALAALAPTHAAADPANAFIAGLASGLGGGSGFGANPLAPPATSSFAALPGGTPHLPSPGDAVRAATAIGGLAAGVGAVRRVAGAASGVAALGSLAGLAAPAAGAAAAAAALGPRPGALLPGAGLGLSAAVARAVESATQADAVATRDPATSTAGDGLGNGHVPLTAHAGAGGGDGAGGAAVPSALPFGRGALAAAIDKAGSALDVVNSAAKVVKTTADDRQVEAGWDLKAAPDALLSALKTQYGPAVSAFEDEAAAVREEIALAAAAAGRVKAKADSAAAERKDSPPAWQADAAARLRAAAGGPAATEFTNAIFKSSQLRDAVAAAAPAVAATRAAVGAAADAVGGVASSAGGSVRVAAVASQAAALQAGGTVKADPGAALTDGPAKAAASAAADVIDYVDDAPCGSATQRVVVEVGGTSAATTCRAWVVDNRGEGARVPSPSAGRRRLLAVAAAPAPAAPPRPGKHKVQAARALGAGSNATAAAPAAGAAPGLGAAAAGAAAPTAAPQQAKLFPSASACDAPILNTTRCTSFPGTLSLILTGGPATVDPDVGGALRRMGLGDLVHLGSLELAAEGGAQAGAGLAAALPELRTVGGGPAEKGAALTPPHPASTAGGELYDPAGLYIHTAPGNTFTSLPAWPMLSTVGGPLLLQGSLQSGLPSFIGLTGVGGGLGLVSNPVLKSTLPGLAGLTSVGTGGGGPAAASAAASIVAEDTVTGGALVIERNPALGTVALPLLRAVGGQVVIRDNPALSRLVLPLLSSVNAGGSVRYGAAAVTITGNTGLSNLDGLLRAASCLDPAATPILIETFPGGGDVGKGGAEAAAAETTPGRGYKCTFTRWAQVCQYALVERGKGVGPGSHWVADGVCVKVE